MIKLSEKGILRKKGREKEWIERKKQSWREYRQNDEKEESERGENEMVADRSVGNNEGPEVKIRIKMKESVLRGSPEKEKKEKESEKNDKVSTICPTVMSCDPPKCSIDEKNKLRENPRSVKKCETPKSEKKLRHNLKRSLKPVKLRMRDETPEKSEIVKMFEKITKKKVIIGLSEEETHLSSQKNLS